MGQRDMQGADEYADLSIFGDYLTALGTLAGRERRRHFSERNGLSKRMVHLVFTVDMERDEK